MSDFSTFFPGSGGGGGGAIGDYGVKPMAYNADTFTDPNDDSVWFKTGYASTDLAAYPKFTPGFGVAAKYPQSNLAAFAGSGTYQGDVQYNSQEDSIVVRQLNSYPIGDYALGQGGYFLDPANISSGNWAQTTTSGHTTSRYSFEPVGDGIGNNYVLKSNSSNTSSTTGSQSQERTSNWLQQSILKIGRVSGGSRTTGYTFNQTINLSGIPTGSSNSSYRQYQVPLGLVATENYFYYSFLQQNPNSTSYLTYYYGNAIFNNAAGNLTDITGQQPSSLTTVYARIRCVKLSKTGAFVSEFTRPFSDISGGGSALLVFTDPSSTGDSFYTLDKNSMQNSIGPLANNYAGFPVRSDLVDFGKTYTIRKHSEDGTVTKTAAGLPITSITQTTRATTTSQQAFCTPNGDVHYFTAAGFAGSVAQVGQKAPNSPLSTTYNIFKLGNIIGDTVTRFTSIPISTTATQTGMGVNTSNVQIKAGPTQAGYSPTQLYIRVA